MFLPSMSILLRDVAMDAVILTAVQLSFGKLNIKRLLAALSVFQLHTIAYLLFGEAARNPIFALTATLTAAFILQKGKRLIIIISSAVVLLLNAAAAAGLTTYFGERFLFAPCFIAVLLFLLIMRKRMHLCYRWNIEIMISNSGKRFALKALIDTGNRLKEPLSGLPVLIIGSRHIPQGFFDGSPFRQINYGVLGSGGMLKAYRTDKITISTNSDMERKAPECFIAVFPGEMPQGIAALAPPEFTEALKPENHPFGRRIKHAIFKHQTVNLRTRGSNSQRFRMLHRRERSSAATPHPR